MNIKQEYLFPFAKYSIGTAVTQSASIGKLLVTHSIEKLFVTPSIEKLTVTHNRSVG